MTTKTSTSVTERFLFRLDMAKDNEQFLGDFGDCKRDAVYAGAPIKVGPGWIPDFVEVVIDRAAAVGAITLIELEATEIAALGSHRKYLPESSASITDAVVRQLRKWCVGSVAPPRIRVSPPWRVFASSCWADHGFTSQRPAVCERRPYLSSKCR